MMPRRLAPIVYAAVAFCALAGLSACGKKTPEGQVVAVVDGQEVTRRELAAEPQVTGLPSSDQAQPMLAALLSGVIDRKLAAAEAHRLKLDRTPEYVAQADRLQEVLLSRTLFDRWAAQMPAPDKSVVSAFIARNPQKFDGRKLLLVDRLVAAGAPANSGALAPLQTNDAIADYLDKHERTYRRERTVIDTASLPLPLYRQLLGVPLNYPIAFRQDGELVTLAVVEARDAPPSADQRTDLAVAALRQEMVQRKLAALRRNADIAYQPGYRPIAAQRPVSEASDGAR